MTSTNSNSSAENYQIAIIGGGIAGLSLAACLSKLCPTVLVEAESQLATHATGRSAATRSVCYGSSVIRQLTSAGGWFFSQEVHETPPLLKRRGLLNIAIKGEEKHFENPMFGQMQRLSSLETLKLCPILQKDLLAGGLYDPDASDIDVGAVIDLLRKQVTFEGGRIHRNWRLLSAKRISGKWTLMSTTGNTISAKIVVNATGAWCDELAVNCGVKKLNVRTTRRTAFVTSVTNWKEIEKFPLVSDLGGRCYFKPETGGLLCSPMDSTDVLPGDITFDELDVARTLDDLNWLTNLNCRHIKSAWAGIRTFSTDGNPICGFDPVVEDFYWLAGQGGAGIQTSTAIAELACADLVKSKNPFWASKELLTQLSPKRFAKNK